jgi:hypothetical protein
MFATYHYHHELSSWLAPVTRIKTVASVSSLDVPGILYPSVCVDTESAEQVFQKLFPYIIAIYFDISYDYVDI